VPSSCCSCHLCSIMFSESKGEDLRLLVHMVSSCHVDIAGPLSQSRNAKRFLFCCVAGCCWWQRASDKKLSCLAWLLNLFGARKMPRPDPEPKQVSEPSRQRADQADHLQLIFWRGSYHIRSQDDYLHAQPRDLAFKIDHGRRRPEDSHPGHSVGQR
jgi:hypothetical protein